MEKAIINENNAYKFGIKATVYLRSSIIYMY